MEFDQFENIESLLILFEHLGCPHRKLLKTEHNILLQ